MATPNTKIDASDRPRKKRLVHRVLDSDPGQEYLVYVPSTGAHEAPVFVSVHGISRNADEHARLLSAYCEMYGVILVAPLFSAERHPDYQRLGRLGRGKRADIDLNSIVAEVSARTGAFGAKFHLFGFSGGAQFAHRYAMAHPHRIAGAVLASAGWYTLPNPTRRFPYGIRQSKKLPGVRFDAEEFLCVPMKVIVGSNDDGHAGLRRSPRLDRDQGATRVERARSWVAKMQEAAEAHHLESMVSYEEIENCDHSFKRSMLKGGLGDRVFQALFGDQPTRAAGAKQA
jgi:pimeloyl-ACP methyl ester carboxylesterase